MAGKAGCNRLSEVQKSDVKKMHCMANGAETERQRPQGTDWCWLLKAAAKT